MAEKQKITVETGKDVAPATPRGGVPTRLDEWEAEMDRLFGNFFSRNWMQPFRDSPLRATFEARLPRVDVVERDHEIAVRAELPGYEKKDIEVSLTERTLSINGKTRKEAKEEKGQYYRREISTGEVSRTLTLPAEVDGQKAKAEFKDGVLEIVIPKIAKSNRVQVEVK